MAVDGRRIAILGAGQIGEALLSGLLSSGWRSADELAASPRREGRAAVGGIVHDASGTGATLFVERGGRTLVPLRDPEDDWLRPAIEALVAHVRNGGAKRLAVERFDGRPVVETEIMPLLVEAGFLAGPRRAVLRG